MKPIIFNPHLVRSIVEEDKPPLLTISKTNFVFNRKATKILSLKKGDGIQLCIDGIKVSLQHASASEGFVISNVNQRGCANITFPGALTALKQHVKVTSKNIRFEIGEFRDGHWPLLQVTDDVAATSSKFRNLDN